MLLTPVDSKAESRKANCHGQMVSKDGFVAGSGVDWLAQLALQSLLQMPLQFHCSLSQCLLHGCSLLNQTCHSGSWQTKILAIPSCLKANLASGTPWKSLRDLPLGAAAFN